MKEIKILYRKPVEAEYKEIKVFDNLDDYLKVYNDGKDFVRTGIGNWKKLKNGDETYYSYSYGNYSYGINYDDLFLTESCYMEMLKYCKKTFKIHECNLFRTQKHINTRFTGDLSSIEDVIDYMNDEKRSWLPQICEEIDEEISEINRKIEELKNKISSLEKDKEKLYDEDYLKSKIETEYTFDSQFYKSIKNSIK